VVPQLLMGKPPLSNLLFGDSNATVLTITSELTPVSAEDRHNVGTKITPIDVSILPVAAIGCV
jgi:hypothetical protein